MSSEGVTTLVGVDYEQALTEATEAEKAAEAEFLGRAAHRRSLIMEALAAGVPRPSVEKWARVGRERLYAIQRLEEKRRKDAEEDAG